jgi:hypothetical protein
MTLIGEAYVPPSYMASTDLAYVDQVDGTWFSKGDTLVKKPKSKRMKCSIPTIELQNSFYTTAGTYIYIIIISNI